MQAPEGGGYGSAALNGGQGSYLRLQVSQAGRGAAMDWGRRRCLEWLWVGFRDHGGWLEGLANPELMTCAAPMPSAQCSVVVIVSGHLPVFAQATHAAANN